MHTISEREVQVREVLTAINVVENEKQEIDIEKRDDTKKKN